MLLRRVLRDLWTALRPGGVLFSSNPRGRNEEGIADGRYACFYDLPTWPPPGLSDETLSFDKTPVRRITD